MEENTVTTEKKPEKKKKGLDIDENFDFIFAKKLSPVLRWILVLPMGLFGFLAVQLAYGFIVNKLLGNFAPDSIVAALVAAIFNIAKFLIIMTAMIATAPAKNKFKAGVVLSVIPFAIIAFMIFVYFKAPADEFYISLPVYIVQLVAIASGTGYALWQVKNHMKKQANNPEETEDTESIEKTNDPII